MITRKKEEYKMKKHTFEQAKENNLEKLKQYVPVVSRVHGPTHPVFYEVQKSYDKIINKINTGNTDLEEDFNNLRTITDNYNVPTDVCETYEAVYTMLKELDQAYKQ